MQGDEPTCRFAADLAWLPCEHVELEQPSGACANATHFSIFVTWLLGFSFTTSDSQRQHLFHLYLLHCKSSKLHTREDPRLMHQLEDVKFCLLC